MNEQNTEAKARYFEELTYNLVRAGFTIGAEENGLLPVELEVQRLCFAMNTGRIRYWKEDAAGDIRSAALDKADAITRTTAEYMSQMESAPRLDTGILKGDYRLLAEFNGVVLAGHPSKFGVQFITWQTDGQSLWQGHYLGPGIGTDCYQAAKQDFAVRSGLVLNSAIFAPEQLTELYRSVRNSLEEEYPISEERTKILKQVSQQIESAVPNLEVRIDNLKKLEAMDAPEEGGMQFY